MVIYSKTSISIISLILSNPIVFLGNSYNKMNTEYLDKRNCNCTFGNQFLWRIMPFISNIFLNPNIAVVIKIAKNMQYNISGIVNFSSLNDLHHMVFSFQLTF